MATLSIQNKHFPTADDTFEAPNKPRDPLILKYV